MTETCKEVLMQRIHGRCTVFHPDSLPRSLPLSTYLSRSPAHFYVKYQFPDINVDSWEGVSELNAKDFLLCKDCCPKELEEFEHLQEFLDVHKKKPLKTFDPFGGIGAFTSGLEQAGCIKTTHAIEISPSASETLK